MPDDDSLKAFIKSFRSYSPVIVPSMTGNLDYVIVRRRAGEVLVSQDVADVIHSGNMKEIAALATRLTFCWSGVAGPRMLIRHGMLDTDVQRS